MVQVSKGFWTSKHPGLGETLAIPHCLPAQFLVVIKYLYSDPIQPVVLKLECKNHLEVLLLKGTF